MQTYHIHIEGQVQGVGFRPYVFRKSLEYGLMGWVSNGIDGVHIEIQGKPKCCENFYSHIIENPPRHSHILRSSMVKMETTTLYPAFTIRESSETGKPTLLMTPDLAICKECRTDLIHVGNRRYHYPFTTCTHCGPRYSIIRSLPYDRRNTAMLEFTMCSPCKTEYNNEWDRRHYSQTNSCSECGVTVSFRDGKGNVVTTVPDQVIQYAAQALNKGRIIAMKGVGGYLLLCNARQGEVVEQLRLRKHRPHKPLAVLYPSMIALRNDCYITETEEQALCSPQAPVVILKVKEKPAVAMKQIAPNLNTLGVMLPYSPLMVMLMEEFQQPVVATSGNESGSPIFYKDEDALKNLGNIADYFITHNLELVVPQDDSVMRYTRDNQRIILRRSRGLAPTCFPNPMSQEKGTWLATGSDLKSAFAMLHNCNVYVSQFLGDLSGYTTLQSYIHVLRHLKKILHAEPETIIVDKHPGYFSSNFGRELAGDVTLFEVQHHHAHLHAVLAENSLHDTTDPVLVVVWDGTGYGDDGNIWGGEFFRYEEKTVTRQDHLPYYAHFANDKFAREPRLAALSLCRGLREPKELLTAKFTPVEWDLYTRLSEQEDALNTSSVGRLFDGVASLLGLCDIATFEGEAALILETVATNAAAADVDLGWFDTESFSRESLISKITKSLQVSVSPGVIAYNFHLALVRWIDQVAVKSGIQQLAFTGGVFQNALLNELIREKLSHRYTLWFHKHLSPNDECIGFGQLAAIYYSRQETVVRALEATTTIETLT